MAIVNTLGSMHFSGKIGDLVFCTGRSGKTYVRKHTRSSKQATEKQLACRLRLKIASGFLYSLKHVIRDTWRRDNMKGRTEMNCAMAEMIASGLTGEYPAISVNYPRVALSDPRGRLEAAWVEAAVQEGCLKLTWSYVGRATASADDKMILVLVDPRTSAVQVKRDAALRGERALSFMLSPQLSAGVLHLYVVFVSKYYGSVSPTVYLQIVH